MSGAHAQLLGHLVRRSADFVMKPALDGQQRDAYITKLEVQANMHKSDEDKALSLAVAAAFIFTFIVFMVGYASIKYTVGEVVASLAMIEQPRETIIATVRPDKENEDPDAPLEKERLLDEEVVVLKEKPLTASIAGTVRHLAAVGGYSARWRGLVIATVYHFLQAMLAHVLTVIFGILPGVNVFAFVIGSVMSTVLLARIHMTWTHIMISTPSPLPWYRRIPRGRTYFKALVTPALIFAIAQHLTVLLPVTTFFSFGPSQVESNPQMAVARCLASLATAAFVGLALLLPATVTLTRVEASLLPDDVETIVPFDRTLGGAAANLVGFGKINFRALYDAAWRSFDKASRIRLIKFYIKYFAIMAALWIGFAMVIGLEIGFFGFTKVFVLAKSSGAQIQLASLGH